MHIKISSIKEKPTLVYLKSFEIKYQTKIWEKCCMGTGLKSWN